MKNRGGSLTKYNQEAIAKLVRSHGFFAQIRADIGSNIFGGDLFAGVLIKELPAYPTGLIVECRNQESHGTAEQKLPFFVLNILERYPCPAVLILDGDGFGDGAISWVEDHKGEKLIEVFKTVGEFKNWFLSIIDKQHE